MLKYNIIGHYTFGLIGSLAGTVWTVSRWRCDLSAHCCANVIAEFQSPVVICFAEATLNPQKMATIADFEALMMKICSAVLLQFLYQEQGRDAAPI
jgi:hypothetical protein